MGENLRALGLLIATSVRASPDRCALAALEVVGTVVGVLKAWWLALLVTGATTGQPRMVWTGVVALVATVGCEWGLGMVGAQARMTLSEKVGFTFDRMLANLTASIPTIEHLERADYLDQVEVLRQQRALLAGGLASLLWSVNVFAMAGTAIVMAAAVDPRLLLLILSAAPAVVGSRLRYRWNSKAEQDAALPGRQARHLASVITTPATGMELRVFSLQDVITRRLGAAIRAWQGPSVWAARRANTVTFGEQAVFALTLGAVLIWLISTAGTSTGTTSAIVVAVVAASQIQTSITDVVYRFGGIADTMRNMRRVLWLRDYAYTENTSHPGTLPAPTRLTGGITLTDVGFTYHGAPAPSVTDLTVHLPAGAVVAIVGENGAGKTTLVKLLTGLYQPQHGQISIDGTDLHDLDITDWRRHTTAAFQDHTRFELTAQHAIGIGDTAQIDDPAAARAALQRAAAGDLETALPHGLASQLGSQWEHGTDLSGGQWQKLALARSLIRTGPLLQVFDEPTAALDAQTEHDLFTRYTAAAHEHDDNGTITLLVTHRFSTARDADLVLVLDHGRLVETGSHDHLMTLNGPYADLYQLQATGYQ